MCTKTNSTKFGDLVSEVVRYRSYELILLIVARSNDAITIMFKVSFECNGSYLSSQSFIGAHYYRSYG